VFGEGTEYWTLETRSPPGSDGECISPGATVVSYSTATHAY
jgi:hypothetical protein